MIVGGGFAGLYAAKRLAARPLRVTLLDQRNYHLFQPLLYQVATAALSAGDIASPIRAILSRQRNAHVVLGEVSAVDLPNRRLTVDGGELPYDYLILATGASHSYFGHGEWEAFAPGLKSLDDAREIRRRVLRAYEEAESQALACQAAGRPVDPEQQRSLLAFVIIGGGPTGVEMAGAIAARHTLAHDFRAIDPASSRILLIEGQSRLLAALPEDLSRQAERMLSALGVEVRTGVMVTGVSAEAVQVGDERIATCTVIWAAGVAASPLAKSLGVPLDRAGRVQVEADLTIPGHPEAYAVGDLAAFNQGGKPLPGVAPVAIQEGRAAADNIWRSVRGEPRRAFWYRDRGTLAIIGRGAGIADLGWIHLSGLPAWLAWLFIHIFFLIGFQNRLLVMTQWAWSYVTYQRSARLITRR